MPTNAQEELRNRRKQRERFARARRAENWYGIQLRKLAAQIGSLSSIYNPDDPATVATIEDALTAFSKIIAPWARNTAVRMLADVAKRDEGAWRELSKEMGIGLREEIAGAPIGGVMKALLDEQVTLITSLPLEAAIRVHELAVKNVSEGNRGENIVAMILASGEVCKSRATLIARTETARVAATLTQARAEFVGSDGYIWRTAKDEDVRRLHRQLEGKFVRWDEPPISGEKGERAHAGCIYNCRCWPEVVLPRLKAA